MAELLKIRLRNVLLVVPCYRLDLHFFGKKASIAREIEDLPVCCDIFQCFENINIFELAKITVGISDE